MPPLGLLKVKVAVFQGLYRGPEPLAVDRALRQASSEEPVPQGRESHDHYLHTKSGSRGELNETFKLAL